MPLNSSRSHAQIILHISFYLEYVQEEYEDTLCTVKSKFCV